MVRKSPYRQVVDKLAETPLAEKETFSRLFQRCVRGLGFDKDRATEDEVWGNVSDRIPIHQIRLTTGQWLDSFSSKDELLTALRKRRVT